MNGVGDQWLEARERRDLEELARLTSEDATWHSPISGAVHGRAAVVEQVGAAYADTDDFSTETLARETRGERTVTHVRNRGRRNGEQLDSHQWLVIGIREALVSDIEIYVDDPAAVEQFWGESSSPTAGADSDSSRSIARETVTRPRAPGILLGIGLGGFLDGIVLHQMLQWHHMLTSEGNYPKTTVAGLETNTLWDGMFHAATWIAVVSGIYLLWRRTSGWRWVMSGRAFTGWMLVGWGGFNLVEGLVDHHLLTLHHVREGVANQWAYDIGFLAFGALLTGAGLALTRSGEARLAPEAGDSSSAPGQAS